MTSQALNDAIEQQRRRFGADLTIMGHHYQSDAVVRHTDITGDSLELSRKTAEIESKYIVFCGVYFMGESAALLARPGQNIYLPEPSAECSMALMADAPALDAVLSALTDSGRTIIPLAYVNSTLAVKAVVGRHGGSVCTSANAGVMLKWALAQGDGVLFLPDRNLALNTANQLDIPALERKVIDVSGQGKQFDPAMAGKARLLIWPGHCSIHTHFTVDQVRAARTAHPGAKIAVHPECTPEVVSSVDACGSTSFLIKYANEMPAGGTLIIGTEINLVRRLAEKLKGRVTILPLAESACEYMAETTEARLSACLETIAVSERTGEDSPFMVRVADDLKAPAKAALERMLAACR